jgi:HSP20 family protein
MQRDFEGLMNRFFGGYEAADGGGRLAPFGVDIREDADHFYVEADLPGFRKEDVEITLENQTLTIAAERREDTGSPRAPQGGPGKGQPQKTEKPANGGVGGGQEVVHLRERRYTRFLRSFTLPPIVDEGSVNAKLHDGVLTITLNKREESKPRKISVS